MALVRVNDTQLKELQRLSGNKDCPVACESIHGIVAGEVRKLDE